VELLSELVGQSRPILLKIIFQTREFTEPNDDWIIDAHLLEAVPIRAQ